MSDIDVIILAADMTVQKLKEKHGQFTDDSATLAFMSFVMNLMKLSGKGDK